MERYRIRNWVRSCRTTRVYWTSLLDRGFLHPDDTLVSIGPEAQRVWGRRNYMELLSVFDTPELYTVFAGNQELGVLHELSFRRESAIVLLGGRSWRVTAVDQSTGSRTSNPPKTCQAVRPGSAPVRASRSKSAKPCAGSYRDRLLRCLDGPSRNWNFWWRRYN